MIIATFLIVGMLVVFSLIICKLAALAPLIEDDLTQLEESWDFDDDDFDEFDDIETGELEDDDRIGRSA